MVVINLFVLSSCAKPSTELELGQQNFQTHHYSTAFKQLSKAAMAGDADAQYAVGYMYYYGKGTDQDLVSARRWFTSAAAQDQPDAVKALGVIEQTENPATSAIYIVNGDVKGEPISSDNFSLIKPKYQSIKTKPILIKQEPLTHQVDSYYTIQLFGSYDYSVAKQFIEQNNLSNNASVQHRSNKGKDWYVVVYGNYATSQDAMNALRFLSPNLQKLKPWVRKR